MDRKIRYYLEFSKNIALISATKILDDEPYWIKLIFRNLYRDLARSVSALIILITDYLNNSWSCSHLNALFHVYIITTYISVHHFLILVAFLLFKHFFKKCISSNVTLLFSFFSLILKKKLV